MSLKIGKAINYLLSNKPAVTALVNNRIYPIAAPDDTEVSFIVYKRLNINAKYTKDGCFENECSVKISVISKDYAESVDIIQAVRDTLELFKGEAGGITIRTSRVESASEDYGQDGYIQEVNFLITTN